MKKHVLFAFVLIFVLALAACGAAAPAQPSGPDISVMEPWSRPSPMTAGNGAVYMTLMNQGGQADTLLSVESDIAESVELHESKMENDVMKMSPIENVPVPAGGNAKLEPGGKHVMLINLKKELVPGQKVKLTLNFEKSGPMTVEAEIREMGAMSGDTDMKMDMDKKN
ncbi:MAG: copper chaperone PCu(A)C [Chloroflexi bacterium]|nr:MAG: copper chaperone PCu(A)C [Chloroflexota bacterium]